MNPVAGVGAVIIKDNHVLLVKRSNPPKLGLWCIPGGKIKFGESLQQAAEREIKEETGITIRAGSPVYVFDLIMPDQKIHYIIVDLAAEYVSGEVKAADDAADAKWWNLDNLASDKIDADTLNLLTKLIKEKTQAW